MITFVCWKWKQPGCRSEYTAEHVNIWASMLKRHYEGDARFICITDSRKGVNIETFPLWDDLAQLPNPNGPHLPSCYRRLKIFNTLTAQGMGLELGEYVVSMDLDVVIVRPITELFSKQDADFAGWKRIGPTKPPGYNGSLFMFKVGTMDNLWDEFDPARSPIITRRAGQFGSDQGWISYKLNGHGPGWTQASGVYSYSSDVYRKHMPSNARIISFNGKHKPWMPHVRMMNPWVVRHWH